MSAFTLLPEERILLQLRKHWILLLRDTAATIMGGILPVLVLGTLSITGSLPVELLPFMPFLQFLLSLWVLVTWLALAVMWTDYYLDIWIVTNKRIVNIEQLDLFNRRVASWRLEDVREIQVHVENIVQTFFKYGTVEIETAGEADAHERVEGIPHPERVRDAIVAQMHTVAPKTPTSDLATPINATLTPSG